MFRACFTDRCRFLGRLEHPQAGRRTRQRVRAVLQSTRMHLHTQIVTHTRARAHLENAHLSEREYYSRTQTRHADLAHPRTRHIGDATRSSRKTKRRRVTRTKRAEHIRDRDPTRRMPRYAMYIGQSIAFARCRFQISSRQVDNLARLGQICPLE